MLDRVACAPMRIEAHPWVDIAALDALTTLLADVSVAGAVSSNIPFATAQVVSCDANRGDHDAMPTQGAPRPSIQDGTLWFHEHGLDLPRRRPNGETVWDRPCYATIYSIISNPAYGGAYAYGKTRAVTGYDGAHVRVVSRRKPRAEWLALKLGAHKGYVDWERAEAIRQMVSDNIPTSRHHGAPKHGDALLAGLLRCRRCGRKLIAGYTGTKHNIPRYACRRGQLDIGDRKSVV